MVSESVNDDIFEGYNPPSAAEKILYYLFFMIPRTELVSLRSDEESLLQERIVIYGLWNKSDRIKVFLVVTLCGLLIWGLLLFLMDGTPVVGYSTSNWMGLAGLGFLLVLAFAYVGALVANSPTIPWLPGEGVDSVDPVQLISSFIITLIVLIRVAVGSIFLSIPIIGFSRISSSNDVGIVLSFFTLLIPVVYVSGWTIQKRYAILSEENIYNWEDIFKNYENLAKRLDSLPDKVSSFSIFDKSRYNPKHTDSLETAQNQTERFGSYLDSYDRIVESHSYAEEVTNSDTNSKLVSVAEDYIRPYDTPEEAAEKAEELEQLIEYYSKYESKYEKIKDISEKLGCAEEFESAVPKPHELLDTPIPAKLDDKIQQLVEWETIYTDYLKLSEKLGERPTLDLDSSNDFSKKNQEVLDSTHLKSHRTVLLDEYSLSTSDPDEAMAQIRQLKSWVKAQERYFELQNTGNDVPFDVNEAAPWNFENLDSARTALDNVEKAIECVQYYRRLLDDTKDRTEETAIKEEKEFLNRIEKHLKESRFEWLDDPQLISKRLNSINRVLELSSQIASIQSKYPAYPFSELYDVIASEIEEGLESTDEIDNIAICIDHSSSILNYLDTVETEHPSIEGEQWKSAIRTALHEQYADHLTPIVRQIDRLKNSKWKRDALDDLNWDEFESIVGVLFEERGFDTKVTTGSVDFGVDVWAESEGERVAIQAKHYAAGNSVGRETLQKITSTLAKGDADKAVVVTSSSFADTAVRYANDFGTGLELIDGEELLRELSEREIPSPT